MTRPNKFKYILSFVSIVSLILFESALAVNTVAIAKNDPEYSRLTARIPNASEIRDQLTSGRNKDSVPAVLKVQFDGKPEYATFISGQCIYPLGGILGGICPQSIFPKDTFEQSSVQLLSEHAFPLDRFNFAMLLITEKPNVVSKVNNLAEQIAALETKYREVQQLEAQIGKATSDLERLEKTAKHLSTVGTVRQEAIKYLMDYVYEVSHWEQLSNFYIGSEIAGNAAPADIDEIKEGIEIITRHNTEAERIIKTDPILAPLLPLYNCSQRMNGIQIRNGFLKLFCRYWGKEAEDALIFKMLQNLEKYDHVPRIIEIYGNKDPCFQCQVKLQWLADNLVDKIREKHGLPPHTPEQRTTDEKLKIVYYAKEEHQAPCLLSLSGIEPWKWKLATRRESEIGKIVKFEFIEGDTLSPPIHAFTPLSMRMLPGRYAGRIKAIDSRKKILEVEITEIPQLIESLIATRGPLPLAIETPGELMTFYNRKKVYIGLSQLPTSLPLERNQIICFEIISDRSMDNELTKKGGVFSMVELR